MILKHHFRLDSIILFVILILNASLIAQGFQWVKSTVGTSSSYGNAITLDNAGNVYITGSFNESVVFGEGEVNETTLNSSDLADFFIAKYNSSGALIWAKQSNSAAFGYISGREIAVDHAGNSYVTGGFVGTITLGPEETNETTLAANSSIAEVFVAKYNINGALLWAKRASGGNGAERWGRGLDVDAFGNCYITGSFTDTTVFGAGEINETTLINGIDNNVFIAKYNTGGLLLWAKQAGGTSGDTGSDIAVDESGNAYITGSFYEEAVFGEGGVNESYLFSNGDIDIFLAKYNSDGVFLWVKNAGGMDNDFGLAVSVDNSGNAYITGRFSDQAVFGNDDVFLEALTDASLFIAKYNSNGSFQWAKGNIDAASPNIGNDIFIGETGQLLVTGYFREMVIFGKGETNQQTLVSSGQTDIFIAQYNESGELQWAEKNGGFASDNGRSIAINKFGSIFATGTYIGTAVFGEGSPRETTLSSEASDIFISRYNPNESGIGIAYSTGWRIISLPLDAGDTHVDSLFSGHTPGSLFSFDGSYHPETYLTPGKGYWINFNTSETNAIFGTNIDSLEIELNAGWNLIGGPNCYIDVSALEDPGDIVVSDFFGYFNGYFASSIFSIGNGYWVRASAPGTITIPCGSNKTFSKNTNFLTQNFLGLVKRSTLEIQDAADGQQKLYFGTDLDAMAGKQNFYLPPIAPAPLFDARFSEDRFVIEGEEATIKVQSSAYPLTVSASDLPQKAGKEFVLQEIAGNRVLKTHVLREGEEVKIANPAVKSLKLTTSSAVTGSEGLLPVEFRIHQNYPNPFNPITAIKYELPAQGNVEIRIYNSLGQQVKTLVSQTQDAGIYEVTWDATNDVGTKVVSGIYYYKISAGAFQAVRKMILLK